MPEMSPRERVVKALNHEEPDRVPIDLGGTHCSTIHIEPYERILAELATTPEPPPVVRRVSQSVNDLDEAVMKRFGLDCVGIMPGGPDNSQAEDLPDGTWIDEFGVHRKMPPNSSNYDMVKSPIENESISLEDLHKYEWPDLRDPGYTRGLKEKAKNLYNNTNYAITGYLLYNIIHLAQYLRGFENWFLDFVLNPEACAKLHEQCCDVGIEIADRFLSEVGEYCQVIMFADDVAGQDGLMIHPDAFRKYIKPQWKRIFDFMRTKTDAKLCLHCCGNITAILDDIVEIGIEVINPVQVSNPQMNTKNLKKRYGNDLSFWGAIDTQNIMPKGSVKDVKDEVMRRIDDLAPGGGYILAAVHSIQPDVPTENIFALYDTALEYGRY
jgi:uroporphyrinogen decarboxylase